MEKAENTKSPAIIEQITEDTESQELFGNLPKEKLFSGTFLYFYQGFWCPSTVIQGIIGFRQHFRANDSDLILVSFPKSGTTWLKALAFTIVNRSKHTLKENPLLFSTPHELVPFLESDIYLRNPSPDLEGIPFPRIFSTHTPYAALPSSIKDSKCRIIYLCRNPLDQLISYWHFVAKTLSETNCLVSLHEIFDMFCRGVIIFGPFWDHILGYWKASQEMSNKVLFLMYEDLMVDIAFQTKLLAEFLGFPFSVEEERQGVVEQVSRLCSFDNQKHLEVNKTGKSPFGIEKSAYFRKAKVGDWSNYLTPPMAEHIMIIIQEKFWESGLTFKFS